MKKFLAILLVVAFAAGFAACANNAADKPDADVKGEGVMTHAEYVAVELDSQVVIETYVQAKQSWWEDKATVYTQDKDGAYFLYNMACSEEDYAKLEKGTKIKVTGYKAEWCGEVEIMDATFEIEEGNYIAEPVDLTDMLANEDELIKHQNEKFSVKGLTVSASKDADGKDVAQDILEAQLEKAIEWIKKPENQKILFEAGIAVFKLAFKKIKK